MSEIFDIYKTNGLSEEIYKKEIENGLNSSEYVSLSAIGSYSKHYFNRKDVNDLIKAIIRKKILTEDKLTDNNLNVNITNVYNILYIDIDYSYRHYENVDEVKQFNLSCAEQLTNIYSKRFKDSHYFTFVPDRIELNEDGILKGGIHILIFLNEPIADRNRINLVQTPILEDKNFNCFFQNYEEHIYHSNPNVNLKLNPLSLIDEQPLSYPMGVIPFSQKNRTSRRYKLIFTNVNLSNLNSIEFITKNPIIEEISLAKIYDSSNDSFNFSELYKINNRITERQKIVNDAKSMIEFKNENESFETTSIDYFIYDFIDGLGSLNDNIENQHQFVRMFKNFNEKRKFEMKLMKFYCVLILLGNKKFVLDEDYICKRLFHLLTPLYLAQSRLHSDEKYQTLKWCFDKIKETLEDFEEYGEIYCKILPLNEKDRQDYYKDVLKSDQDTIRKTLKIGYHIEQIFSEWSNFVIEKILKFITFEIEPFGKHDYSRGKTDLTFSDVLPYNFKTNLIEAFQNNEDTEYLAQLKNLNKMFIWCLTYQYGINSPINIYSEIISAYTKYYITCKTNETYNNKPKIYLYNICQIENLKRFPYNQWLHDKDEYFKEWTFLLYRLTIEPLLKTSEINKFGGLGYPIKILENTKILEKGKKSFISSLSDKIEYKQFSDKLYSNVINIYKTGFYINPRDENPEESEYFSMRNGILHWKKNNATNKYECVFEKNNREIILGTYTLVNYVDPKEYDFNSMEYKEVENMLRQVYPIEEEYEYILDLFSTIICPIIKKDQMLIAFGTGGDGKSTINSILSTILGDENSENTNYIENGRIISLSIPRGYSGNVEPSTFTHEKNRSSHDEGGKINMARKTFVVSQEPKKGSELITSTIKDLTSGAISHGRQIHQKEITFKNNALIVVETNEQIKYDKVDDAVKRRMIVYNYKSKFYTKVNEKSTKNLKYRFKANGTLISNVLKRTEYWTALFQILLPRALKLLNEGKRYLSEIEKPISIDISTKESFDNSNNLLRWFSQYVVESPNSYIFVNDLIEMIKNQNEEMKQKNENLLVDIKDANREIIREIQSKFSGHIYKINKKYLTKIGGRFKLSTSEKEKFENEVLVDGQCVSNNDLKEKFTDGNGALTNIETTHDPKCQLLILIGYEFLED